MFAGHHCLAEVVVEILLGVRITGVERAGCGGGWSSPRPPSTSPTVPPTACTIPHRLREVEIAVDREEMGEGRRLGEELERQAVSRVIGVQQIAGEGEELAAVLRLPVLVDRVELARARAPSPGW